MDFILVALGGGVGAVCRYGVGLLVVGRLDDSFPFNTLLVNVSGSLAIGILVAVLTEMMPAWRLLLIVGFLGGYTTFSSYTYEAVALAEAGSWGLAAWYIVGSNG